MELTTLRYFQAIARAGHMTRAARSLGVTQPALSAMVKKLESEVGVPLLDRTGKGVALTEAGRVFLSHAEEALRKADAGVAAVRQLAGLEAGSIRIGGGATATTYILPRVVSEFHRAHPAVRFFVRETGSASVASMVASGELDLGIVTLPLEPGEAERVVLSPLAADELRLIVPAGPPRHALTGRRQFSWGDLRGQGVVAFEAGSAVREIIDAAARAAGVELSVAMELRSIESIKRMVAAGIGVGFVSRFALKDGEGSVCKDGRLVRELAVVRSNERAPSAAVAVFEKMLMRAVKA